MSKVRLLISYIVIFLSVTCLIAGCYDNSGKPDDADKITERLLQSIIDVDFDTYSNCFAEELRPMLGNEDDFIETTSQISTVYGEYVENTLKYTGFETTDEGYIRVFYDAEFTKVGELQVLAVFQDSRGDTEVVGFFLNLK
ncbi:MAG: hypothetical protein JSU79_10255 [Dehalococcoidales bacterium]|nr:MAG: hypothetical protein JSU79_10255 [Dehalococcoidales bacterium]